MRLTRIASRTTLRIFTDFKTHMSIYIYAPKLFPGTRELIDTLQAKRLVRHDGMHFLYKGVPVEFGPQDTIVCWGAHAPPIPKVPCLNASGEHPGMLDFNTRAFEKLARQGYSIFAMQRVSDREWLEGLPERAGAWWPKKAPVSKVVSVPEFEGYVTRYHNFTSTDKITIFCGDVVVGKANANILALWPALKLDFGELYIGDHRGAPFLLKVITAPALDAQGVRIFADRISSWAKQMLSGNNITSKMEGLLE